MKICGAPGSECNATSHIGNCSPHAVIRGRSGSIFALTGVPIHEPIVARMQRAAETPFRRDAAVTYDPAIERFILPSRDPEGSPG